MHCNVFGRLHPACFIISEQTSKSISPSSFISPDAADGRQLSRPPSCQLQPGGSAGHRVAMLESLKAGLVGADCCLIVAFQSCCELGVRTGLHAVWGHSGGRGTEGIQPSRVSLICRSKGHRSYASVG